MKKINYVIIAFILISCSQQSTEPKAQTVKPTVKCQSEVNYGDIILCNPEIVGMQECLTNEKIRLRQDNLSMKGSKTLGYYISSEKYKNLEILEKLKVSDIIKIYALEAYSKTFIGIKELNSTFAILKNNYIIAEWDSLKLVLENKNLDFEISQPILIDSYSLNDNAKSATLLMRASKETDERITVMTMNLLICKNRLIFLSYYLEYTGIESVTKAKAKNDYIALRFLEAN